MSNAPRPTPYARGQMAARNPGSLKALPYGPGPRQDEFIRGFRDERAFLDHKSSKEAA